MKKAISLILAILMLTGLAGCAAGGNDDGICRIAIIQHMDHSSLDEIRNAVIAELERSAKEQGATIDIKTFNAQNDFSLLNQICTEVASEGYDAVIPIATPAAQAMVTAADGAPIPIIYAAISDPESAGLTGMDYVTGVSDALNTPFILDMMFAVQPQIQTVGLLYSNSETNSETPIREAKAYLDSKGIPYIEKTGTTTGEIVEAASSLVGRVDAVFTPTDNAVMGAEAAVAEILNDAGIPHYAGADSFVLSGAFATCGVNYTDLGTKTAQIALEALASGTVPTDFHIMEGGIITVSDATAMALGLDYSVFDTMAGTVTVIPGA